MAATTFGISSNEATRSTRLAHFIDAVKREFEAIAPIAVRRWIDEGLATQKGVDQFNPPEALLLCVAAIKLEAWEEAGIAKEFPCALPCAKDLLDLCREIANVQPSDAKQQAIALAVFRLARFLSMTVFRAWFDYAAHKPLGVNADCVIQMHIAPKHFLELMCDFFLALPDGDADSFTREVEHEQ